MNKPSNKMESQDTGSLKINDSDVLFFCHQKNRQLRDAIDKKHNSPEDYLIYTRLVNEYNITKEMIERGSKSIREIELAIKQGKVITIEKSSDEGCAAKKESESKGSSFSTRLETLISAALQDGVLTDKEREVLKRRAEADGEDWDEVEMIVEARLAEMHSATSPSVSQPEVKITPSTEKSSTIEPKGKEGREPIIHESINPQKPIVESKKEQSSIKGNGVSKKFGWRSGRLYVLCDGNKYAIEYKGDYKSDYIYDDVICLSTEVVRLAQKQEDGSFRYGLALTNGHRYTDCEYTKISFLDGKDAVLAIDEDGDEYAIDIAGIIYDLNCYREKCKRREE